MTKTLHMQGAFTALVTPFNEDASRVDFDAFDALVTAQVAAGISGLVPCGTTGEAPTLSEAEQAELVRRCVALVGGRVPVIAGTGSNSTAKTISASQAALEAGADGVMVVMPYYNKPTQEGLFAHVTAVAREISNAPLVLYNIPGRSAVDLSFETLLRIADAAPNLAAVKDATGNVLRCQQVVRKMGDRVSVMCGDDALTLAMMAVGAKGVISVTSNIYPAEVSLVCRLARDGKWDEARRAHFGLLPVHDAMFVEANPGPVKAALAARAKICGVMRLPMAAPTETSCRVVVDALACFDREVAR